ncbi:MAG TPA: pantoate--beta-alanine ligase [Chloroflexi bacterium]|nr:pantoate--beta-alanine ligase [Chloroflexota bacterium]
MEIVKSLNELRNARQNLPAPLGLVPTMGFLHPGHLSLVRRARAECAAVAVSIFVNPTQFGPQEDLAAYPRDLEKDLALLQVAGVDLVWLPTNEVMYPAGYQTWVDVESVTQTLEGARRPGHFRGVATVVAKLFNGVQPHKAYFGQKDAQQAVVIRQMARDLNFPLEIVICPLIRETDGLAMSSRNTYLNPEQRQAATVLSRALRAAKAAYEAGDRVAENLRQVMIAEIEGESLAHLQYVSVAHPDTLEELNMLEDDALFSMAVYVGQTRLIDNFLLQAGRWQVGERINERA